MTGSQHTTDARRRGAFRIIDALAVVIMLGILASLAGPQVSTASTMPGEDALRQDIQKLRRQIALFAVRHHDLPPGQTQAGVDADLFVEQLTGDDGFGPYLASMPVNTINGQRTVRIIAAGAIETFIDNTAGWVYQPSTRRIAPDTPGVDSLGVPFADY